MSTTEVSRRYAKALLGLSKQKGTHKKTLEELREIAAVFKNNADIGHYFADPVIAPEQKMKTLKAAFENKGLSEEVFGLLVLLAERHRMGEFYNVVEAYQNGIDAEDGITRGVARAAKPLSPEGQKALEEKISSTLKKKIVLSFKEDPTILGGVIAHVGGWTFDDSLENHLKKLNADLNRSAE